MTLEEAIKHAEEVAESCQLKAYNIERDDYKDLEECVAEHRQLAEWLRELKRLRAQNPCEDAVSRAEAIDAALSAFSRGLLASPDIRKLPSVQPEIIRCKDCKWMQGSECVRFAEVRPFPDDFCSKAERRTDG